MDAPLGRAVGNACEVVEALETLKGRGPADVETLSLDLAARMLVGAGGAPDDADARRRVRRALDDGSGLEVFRAIVEAQHGDARVIDDYGRLPQAAVHAVVPAPGDGVIVGLEAETIGRAAVSLGAGRGRVDDAVDPAAGIVIAAPVGTRVRRGDPVLRLAAASRARLDAAQALLHNAIVVGEVARASGALVLDVVTPDAVVPAERLS
jgi:thymidine phosphorylase